MSRLTPQQIRATLDADAGTAEMTPAQLIAYYDHSVPQWHDLTQAEMLRWCAAHNIIARFKLLQGSADAVIQSIAEAGLILITSPAGLQASNSETRAMMTAMRTKNMVTQDQLDDLIARAQESVPRWRTAGWPANGTEHQFTIARALA